MTARTIPVAFGVIDAQPRRYAKGGLVQAAEKIRKAGRKGDTVVVHLSPEEFAYLKATWGEPTINPVTGLPEYFRLSRIFRAIAPILPIVASVLAPGLGTALGSALGAGASWAPVVGNAILGAGMGGLGGGGRGALIGGLTGGAASALAPVVSNALSGTAVGDFFGMKGGNATVFDSLIGGAANAGGGASTGLTLTPGATTAGGNTIGGAAATPVVPPPSAGGPVAGSGGGGALTQIAAGTASAPQAASGATTAGGAGPSWFARNRTPLLLGGGLLAANALSRGEERPAGPAIPESYRAGGNFTPANYTYTAESIPDDGEDWYTYGMRSQSDAQRPRFMRYNITRAATGGYMAHGGPLNAIADHGPKAEGQVSGPGTGRSDEIPAQLSDGEYVIDAETVALLGDGSSEAGARRLDAMRANVRKHKGRALSQGRFSPNAKEPERYLAGGRAR